MVIRNVGFNAGGICNLVLFVGLLATSVRAIPVQMSTVDTIKYPIYVACECDYSLYVDDKYIHHDRTEVKTYDYLETGWNATKRFYPYIHDESPKIIAFNGVGNQHSGFLNGFIMDMNNGKDYTKHDEWKCKDFSKTVSKVPPVDWFTFDYNDSDWEMSATFGKNYQNNSFQIYYTERREIHLQAEWLWTSDNTVSNLYCRKKNEKVRTIPLQTSAPPTVSKTIHTTPVQTSAPHIVQTSAPHIVQTSAPHIVSKTIHATPVQTSAPHIVQISAPHIVQTSAPHIVQTSAPHPVQTSAPHIVQTSAPHIVQTSAPHTVSKTIHTTPVQTSAPHIVQTSAPHIVQTSAPHIVQTSAPHIVQTSAPHIVQTSAPHPVQTSAPHPVQTSAPHIVQTSAPHIVQTSAPHIVQTLAPHIVQTSAPHIVQTSAPHIVQTSAPHPVQTSAHHIVQTSAPHIVQTSAPHIVQTSAPPTVSKTIHTTPVQTSAPHIVQTSAPHIVSKMIHTTPVQPSAPHIVQTSAPHIVQTSAPPPSNYNIIYSPHIKIVIKNIIYSRKRSYNHINNLLHRIKMYNDHDNDIYNQVTDTRNHIENHYNTMLHDIKILLHSYRSQYKYNYNSHYYPKYTRRFIESMNQLNKSIKNIEHSLQFIKGNHKYILLRILHRLKMQYQNDTLRLLYTLNNDFK